MAQRLEVGRMISRKRLFQLGSQKTSLEELQVLVAPTLEIQREGFVVGCALSGDFALAQWTPPEGTTQRGEAKRKRIGPFGFVLGHDSVTFTVQDEEDLLRVLTGWPFLEECCLLFFSVQDAEETVLRVCRHGDADMVLVEGQGDMVDRFVLRMLESAGTGSVEIDEIVRSS